jgi:hypothetical protein
MIGWRQSSACHFLPQQIAERRLHGSDRKLSKRSRHAHHRPDAADIAQRNQQCRFRLHASEQTRDVGFVRGCKDRV